jgi:hypothetical protein
MRIVDYRTLPKEETDTGMGSPVDTCVVCGCRGIYMRGFGADAGRAGFEHVIRYDDDARAGYVVEGCRLVTQGGDA